MHVTSELMFYHGSVSGNIPFSHGHLKRVEPGFAPGFNPLSVHMRGQYCTGVKDSGHLSTSCLFIILV